MSKVTIHLLNAELMANFYFTDAIEVLAESLLSVGEYSPMRTIEVDKVGTDAAEEMFDLTNNPNRIHERKAYFGFSGRSMSVGDVCQVDNRFFVCAPMGWKQVEYKSTK